MICRFRQLDGAKRPVVSVRLLPGGASIDCLIDTGSPDTCFPKSFADRNGVLLAGDPGKEFSIVGATQGWPAPVKIWVTDVMGGQSLGPLAVTAYFCDPWVRQVAAIGDQGRLEFVDEPRSFGILGLVGGLDQLKLTVWGHLGLFELEREGFDRYPGDNAA